MATNDTTQLRMFAAAANAEREATTAYGKQRYIDYSHNRRKSASEWIRHNMRMQHDYMRYRVGLPYFVGTITHSVKAKKRRGLFWCTIGTQDNEREVVIVPNTRQLPEGAIKPLHPITGSYRVAMHGVALAHLPPLWIYALEDYINQETAHD